MLDELEGAETRARQAEERTRAFLADAAHELRTPITGVQAAAETLLHHGDALSAADREHLQALLVREAQRAGTLISDLLAAARLDAGVELHREPVSLGHLAASELDRVRLLHPEATVTTGGGPDVVVTADADKVRGILRNVVENATRAAGPQGRIHLNLYAQDGFAVLDLWDSGPGVPPSERERIFERLVRLDHSRSADAGGSGLGLAIARGYARAHGGDLVCLDPGGPGALFRLTLPASRRKPDDLEGLSESLHLPRRRSRGPTVDHMASPGVVRWAWSSSWPVPLAAWPRLPSRRNLDDGHPRRDRRRRRTPAIAGSGRGHRDAGAVRAAGQNAALAAARARASRRSISTPGTHNWVYWNRDLRKAWPMLTDALGL